MNIGEKMMMADISCKHTLQDQMSVGIHYYSRDTQIILKRQMHFEDRMTRTRWDIERINNIQDNMTSPRLILRFSLRISLSIVCDLSKSVKELRSMSPSLDMTQRRVYDMIVKVYRSY